MSVPVTSDKIEKTFDLYDIKVKIMGDKVQVFEYSDMIRSLKDGMTSPFKKRENYSKSAAGEIRVDSLTRSFARLMDLAITNHDTFTTFITLTFKDNIKDLSFANKMFNNWVTTVRRVYPDFKYLGVPEFQKRGAVHYHVMTNLKVDSDLIKVQNTKENMYDVKYWSHGFTSVFDLSLSDNNFSVSLYLAKYFYKDIDNRLFSRKKVLASRNLKEPIIEKFNSLNDELTKIDTYLKNKKLSKQKDIIATNDYAPRYIRITDYE